VFSCSLICQSDFDQELSFYSDALVNCRQDENRQFAHESFYNALKTELEKELSFYKDLSFLKAISMQTPPDSSFRIISWQLFETKGNYRYFAFLQMANGDLHEWKDQIEMIEDLNYEVLDPSYWYGGLFYNLEPFESDGLNYYFLYSYSQLDEFTRRKILDVLYFEGDKPMLGRALFEKENESSRPDITNRLIVDYSADVGVTLNYNPEMNAIIFDHLIPQKGRMPGQGISFYPDGSYEGYIWDDGKWKYKEKIFDQVLDEAPRPKPVLGKGKKGLFGQDKNKK
jgi:hypothetical protein